MKPKLRALLVLSGGAFSCSPSPVLPTVSETRVASESAIDGLSESPRSNTGVSGLSTVIWISESEISPSTDFVGKDEVGVEGVGGGGGAHSNSR